MHLRNKGRSNRRARLTAAVALPAGLAAAVLGVAAPAQAAGPVAFPGSVPAWATQANDAGAAPADTTVEGEIYLTLKDLKGATDLATAVSTPGSPQFRQFVSPQQWIDRFAPDAASFDQLVATLKAKGLTVTGTPASRLFVVFRGTAAQMGSAFNTQLRDYTVDGHRLAAPATAPSVPAAIAPAVSGLEIDQGRTLTRPDSRSAQAGSGSSVTSPPASTADASKCSTYYDQYEATLPAAYGRTSFPTYLCGYTPAQLRSAYGIGAPAAATALTAATKSSVDGRGQTVAIIDAYGSPTIRQDVDQYSANRHEPALGAHYSEVLQQPFTDQAACGYPSGWQGEQTLDVEAVHGIAPAADIHYVGASNCNGGIDVALSSILDTGSASIVSNSYGTVGEDLPADAIQGQENQHLQAAAEGIGLYYSSGDSGDEAAALGTPEPDYEASSPWVTSVGGTSTGITAQGTVSTETGWGSHRVQDVNGVYEAPAVDATGKPVLDANGKPVLTPTTPPGPFRFGAGGGRSTVFGQPSYQKHVVPAQLARGKRVSPDIAADADPYTGMLIGVSPLKDAGAPDATGTYSESSIGGTSLASPLVAAQMALVQQADHLTIGFANPTLYAAYGTGKGAFRDVSSTALLPLAYGNATSGASYLVTGNLDTSLEVGPGYDDVTGLGAVSFPAMRAVLAGRH